MTAAAAPTPGPSGDGDVFGEVVDEFAALAQRERLQLLLEYSDDLPALPERYAAHRDAMEPVPECQSPLYLAVEVDPADRVHLFFDAPREAPTTRGFAGVLAAALDGEPAPAVLAVADDAPLRLGLSDAVSPLRMRGMLAMLSRVKRQVRTQLTKPAAERAAG